jgi:hypothetical protein
MKTFAKVLQFKKGEEIREKKVIEDSHVLGGDD